MIEKLHPTVMKFGGTSVGDVAAFERVVHIVSTQIARHPVVVVSAMTRVTDALLAAFELAKKGETDEAVASLMPYFERHYRVSRELIRDDQRGAFDVEIEYARIELADLLKRVSRRSLPLSMLKDAVVSYGEQLSSSLLAEVLKSNGIVARQVDARRLIVTDDEYGSAQPIWDETEDLIKLELQPLIKAGEVPVMGGFIAANRAYTR